MPEIQELLRLPDPEQAVRAGQLLAYHQAVVEELGRARRACLHRLISEHGWDRGRVAAHLGLTRTRVGQIMTGGHRPERAVLGTGDITVAVGGKWEAPKPHGQPSVVISREALAARDLIFDAARDCGLAAAGEVLLPPGMVRLSRPNLIVLGSPRVVPTVAGALEHDPWLGFSSDESGWHLTSGSEVQRSPSDKGEPRDYAYLGRLPRPDGNGTFLYVAGIHAMGTLGAALYLTSHLEELHHATDGHPWSTLVACSYHPDTRAVTSVELLTPVRTYGKAS